jgi:hypothetical protein
MLNIFSLKRTTWGAGGGGENINGQMRIHVSREAVHFYDENLQKSQVIVVFYASSYPRRLKKNTKRFAQVLYYCSPIKRRVTKTSC